MTDPVPLPSPSPRPKSIATVSLSGALPEKLEAAAAIGFYDAEIFENDLLACDGSSRDVREIAGGLGLAITLFQPFRDFEAMPDPLRARTLDRAERKSDVMQALGTDLVLVCSNIHPLAIDDETRAAADLAEMAEHASPRGLFDGIEILEFAFNDDTGRRLGETLAGWDFTMSAKIAPRRSIGSARGHQPEQDSAAPSIFQPVLLRNRRAVQKLSAIWRRERRRPDGGSHTTTLSITPAWVACTAWSR
jgi:hypothetical protein